MATVTKWVEQAADLFTEESKMETRVRAFADELQTLCPSLRLELGKPQGIARWHVLDLVEADHPRLCLAMLRIHIVQGHATHVWMLRESERLPYSCTAHDVTKVMHTESMLRTILEELVTHPNVSACFVSALRRMDP